MKMKRNHMFMMAGALALAVGVAGTAMAQSSAVAQAMAAGTVGEQADGYLGVKGSVAAAVKAEVDSINIKRRAAYTDLAAKRGVTVADMAAATGRSEEHTSELQSLMRISYAVFCLKKKPHKQITKYKNKNGTE